MQEYYYVWVSLLSRGKPIPPCHSEDDLCYQNLNPALDNLHLHLNCQSWGIMLLLQLQFSYHLSEHSLFVCSRIHLDRTAVEEEMCHFLLVATQLTIIKENISSVVFTVSPADGCRTLGDMGPSLQPLTSQRGWEGALCLWEDWQHHCSQVKSVVSWVPWETYAPLTTSLSPINFIYKSWLHGKGPSLVL